MLAATTATMATLLMLPVGELLVRLVLADVGTTTDATSWFTRHWLEQEPPKLNALGFREREIAVEHPAGVQRIAVIGDSFTWGQGVTPQARFTDLLERKLGDAGRSTEVLNFGRPGSDTVHHVQTLEDVVFPLDPDFVLLAWFVNDVEGGNDEGRPRSWRLLPSDRLTAWLHEHSALYFLANQQWRWLQVRAGLTPRFADSMVERFGDPEGRPALDARAALEAFVERCAARGVPVGIAAFPLLQEPDDPASLGFLVDRVMQFCDLRELPCADMRHAFAGVRPASRLWVNRYDPHPGPLAHALAAAHLLEVFGPQWRRERAGDVFAGGTR